MIQIANAPCSWGVIENTEGERFGYKDVLAQMQAAGYAGTELGDWGFMPTDPARLSAALAAHQLQLLGSWVTVRLYDEAYHDRGIELAVKTAGLMAEVGGPDCFVIIGDDHSTVPDRLNYTGRIKAEHGLDDAGWEVYTRGAMRVAETVKRETGLRSLIHHHGACYVETPAEINRFLANTDASLIGLCFDTGHCALGGGDPVDLLTTHSNRIWHVHFKDFDPAVVQQAKVKNWNYQEMIGKGLFPELGQGVIDFQAVLETLGQLGYDDWIVVEQDVLPGMGTPAESARRNREYIADLGI